MDRLEKMKTEIRKEAAGDPDKFFPTDVLRDRGFSRGKCENCGNYFWSVTEREVCDEPGCGGGYHFIDNSPTEREYGYVEIWERFRDFMEKRGYRTVRRYPVVARWRDDTEFVRASIYNFQPHVVSGEVEPPARELIVPQPSLRFNDVDNVGITGRHYVLHDHIGQHAFQSAENYKQDRYFRDMLVWAVEGMGVPEDRLVIHEDSWGGGGNLGASMEFFVDGLELWNQVYMFYRIAGDGYEELDLKVLDMGMGHERITWVSQGSSTSYDAVMPEVMGRLYERTGMAPDSKVWKRFLPYSGMLNIDEVEDIDEVWERIGEETGYSVRELKENVLPLASLYSVAEHSRALLFALADGKLPSNTGGGHDLRMIARRAMGFIDEYGWDVSLEEVVEWHADELEEIFPKVKKRIDEVKEILKVERERYESTKRATENMVKELSKEELTEDRIIELYDSRGVPPQMLERELGAEIPDNFYSRVAEKHEEGEAEDKKRFDVSDIPKTEKLYYEKEEFDGEVVGVLNYYVAFDKTAFYPTSGGQMHDRGRVNGRDVVEVVSHGGVILHRIPEHGLEVGDEVHGKIDPDRRKQITQHHSATHLINAVTREVLGDHIYQAGAYKDMEKGRLDVTHYEIPPEDTVEKIQERANEVVKRGVPVEKTVLKKNEAEEKYGFDIYQGGAVPGNEVRIVRMGELDAEACGGTHVENTEEIGNILITDVRKIQDSVVRFEFTAGDRTMEFLTEMEEVANRCKDILDAELEEIPDRSKELFEDWKRSEKKVKELEREVAKKRTEELEFENAGGKRVLVESVEGNMEELRNISRDLTAEDTCIILLGIEGESVNVLGSVGEEVDLNVGSVVRNTSKDLGGKGGGDERLGQGVGHKKDRVDEVLESTKKKIKKKLVK